MLEKLFPILNKIYLNVRQMKERQETIYEYVQREQNNLNNEVVELRSTCEKLLQDNIMLQAELKKYKEQEIAKEQEEHDNFLKKLGGYNE